METSNYRRNTPVSPSQSINNSWGYSGQGDIEPWTIPMSQKVGDFTQPLPDLLLESLLEPLQSHPYPDCGTMLPHLPPVSNAALGLCGGSNAFLDSYSTGPTNRAPFDPCYPLLTEPSANNVWGPSSIPQWGAESFSAFGFHVDTYAPFSTHEMGFDLTSRMSNFGAPSFTNTMGSGYYSTPYLPVAITAPNAMSSYSDVPMMAQPSPEIVYSLPTLSSACTSGTLSDSNSPVTEPAFTVAATTTPSERDSPTHHTAAQTPWSCNYCSECFVQRRQLSIHLKKHTLVCPVAGCARRSTGFATNRDRNRHLHSKHKDYAREHNLPSEKRKCGVPGCLMVSRADNLTRHLRIIHNIDRGKVSRGARRGRARQGI